MFHSAALIHLATGENEGSQLCYGLLASYPADIASSALAARELVLTEIADAVESVDIKAKVIVAAAQ